MKVKVLHIIPTLNKGGAERLTIDICKEQINQGFEVKLIVLHSQSDYDFLLTGLNVLFLDLNFEFSILRKHKGNIFPLQTVVNIYQPDIIHGHLFESIVVMSQLKDMKSKFFLHFHDNIKQFSKNKILYKKSDLIHFFVRKKILYLFKNRDVRLIAVSIDTQKYIFNNLPNIYKVFYLPNAIDRSRFLYQHLADRKELSLVMIGSMVDKKNQEFAINIVKALHNLGYKFTLDLIGDGPNRPLLQQLVSKLNLGAYVNFLGKIDYPEDYLKSRMIYLHTACYEPFGLVFLEAMTAKIPIVCLDGKGNSDLIRNQFNGIIINQQSVHLFTQAIISILSDSLLRKEIVKNAFEFSIEFSIEKYVEKLNIIYNS